MHVLVTVSATRIYNGNGTKHSIPNHIHPIGQRISLIEDEKLFRMLSRQVRRASWLVYGTKDGIRFPISTAAAVCAFYLTLMSIAVGSLSTILLRKIG